MSERRVLVICFGNPMRGDDGVALRVAELLASRDATQTPRTGEGAASAALPAGVEVRALMQLDVALAEDIAAAHRVIFADAEPVDAVAEGAPASECPTSPRLVDVATQRGSGALRANVHAVTPADLVSLARRLYGRSPAAQLVAVPAFRFDHGEGLSEPAERAAREAASLILRMLS